MLDAQLRARSVGACGCRRGSAERVRGGGRFVHPSHRGSACWQASLDLRVFIPFINELLLPGQGAWLLGSALLFFRRSVVRQRGQRQLPECVVVEISTRLLLLLFFGIASFYLFNSLFIALPKPVDHFLNSLLYLLKGLIFYIHLFFHW